MDVYEFPALYADRIKEKAKCEVSEEELRHDERLKALEAEKKYGSDVKEWVRNGAIAGFVPGIIMAFATSSWALFFLILFTLTALGAAAGYFIVSQINLAVDRKNHDTTDKMLAENFRNENELKAIDERAQNNIDLYTKDFENRAQQISIQYADSPLASEVIEWMSTGFSKTIRSADRRSHIAELNIPFSFNVFTDKIVCGLGTYDFELKRCARLGSPLEQTALARAIASAIMLNITMEFDEDISGTAFKLDIAYSYKVQYSSNLPEEMYASTLISYKAPNGNYRDVKNW